MDIREIIAKNICELRTESGMTQIQLAEKLNYSDKAVSKWERAESIPDIAVLKQIADLFSVSVDYLIEEKHSASLVTEAKARRIHRVNQTLFTVFASIEVWLVAAIIFAILMLRGTDGFHNWLVFIYAIPASAFVICVFNLFWQKSTILGAISVSLISWGIVLSVYLSLLVMLKLNIWPLFIAGALMQVINVLISVFIYLKKKGAKK